MGGYVDQLKFTCEIFDSHIILYRNFNRTFTEMSEQQEAEETSTELFFHPETGERISKNAYKKLLKGK